MERPHDQTVSPPCRSKSRYGHLSEGSKVEATSMAEGFVDSWFEAKVVKPPKNPMSSLKWKRLTLIEYVNLVNEKGTQLLKEEVDVVLLRPLPPKVLMEGDDDFREGDLVDCFERDGWWTGKVKTLVKLRNKEEGGRYLVRFEVPEHEIEFRREDMRVHLDWMKGKWFHLQDDVLQELSITADGHVTLANIHCRSGPKELVGPEHQAVMGISAESFVDDPATLLDQTLSPGFSASCQQETIYVEYPNSSSTHSPPSKKLKRPCADPFVHVSTKPAELTIEDSDGALLFAKPAVGWRDNDISPLRDCQHKETGGKSIPGAKSIHCFKRRKIKKYLSEGIPVTLVAAEVEEVDDVHKDQSMEEHSLMAVGRELTHEKKENVQKAESVYKKPSIQEQDEVQVDENVREIPCMEDQSLVSVGTEMTHKGHGEVQKAMNVHKNPSLELEAVGTEVTHGEQGHSHLVKNDGGRETTVIDLSKGQQPTRDDVEMTQSLPFVKSSPIWKYLESLEVLRKFPQKPHFLPLIEAGERTREEYAIAKTVTFASTLEDAIKLSVNDPVSTITDCLETFHLLESDGFDTKTVESRLRKLLSLKDKQQRMEETKNEVERQISELTHKRVKLAADIYETDHKIKVYEQQLALAFLEKEEADRKISILKTSLDVMETVMHSTLSCLMDENSP